MRRAFKFREGIWHEQPYWLGQLEAREHGLAPNRKSYGAEDENEKSQHAAKFNKRYRGLDRVETLDA